MRVANCLLADLRGVGQVMFQDNPLTGALFLVGIVWGSCAAGVPHVAIGGVVAVVVATLTAKWLRVDEERFAPACTASMVSLSAWHRHILLPGPLLWVYVVLGAPSRSSPCSRPPTWSSHGGAALTFPFVLVTWVLLLATYRIRRLTGTALPAGGVVTAFEPDATPFS